ncbi:hypothetical protein J6590_029495 [Homalodisca vitripennis]|nr:hypothetical protein J6590_029495 [Homalodisca vitripennis]
MSETCGQNPLIPGRSGIWDPVEWTQGTRISYPTHSFFHFDFFPTSAAPRQYGPQRAPQFSQPFQLMKWAASGRNLNPGFACLRCPVPVSLDMRRRLHRRPPPRRLSLILVPTNGTNLPIVPIVDFVFFVKHFSALEHKHESDVTLRTIVAAE